ncbi:MAG: alpha/beta fold hydrolase [bacterium]
MRSMHRSLRLAFVALFVFTAVAFGYTAKAQANFFGQTCEIHNLPVHLVEGDPTVYNLVGKLCWRGHLHGKPLQLMVHGATLNKEYWDFPYGGSRYSYVDFANLLGFATFAYDRIGSGESDRAPGILLNVGNAAYVNHQVVQALRGGTLGARFEKIIQLGHSFGSLISVAGASTYVDDIDGLVLTGFTHQATTQAVEGTQAHVYPAFLDPKFANAGLDETYFTTRPGSRTLLFFNPDNTDPQVLTVDEAEKDIMTLGLILDIPRHLSHESLAVQVPVLMITGSDDFFYCGENVDCHNNASYRAYESGFFNTDLETKIIPNVGHSLFLHKNSLLVYAIVHDWIFRKTF